MPVSTTKPFARSFSLKSSHNGFAISGRAASIKLGLLPFRVSAYKVN